MLTWLLQSRLHYPFKLAVALIMVSFVGSGIGIYLSAHAESLPYLPAPGNLITTSQAFAPVLLKGVIVDSDNPFKLKFILDEGDTKLSDTQLNEETNILVRYFLSALTIPASDMWVNLSPYEKDSIVPQEFGETDIGRDMLAQDYILKQLSASLTYPDSPLGKEYWDNIHKKSQALYGTTNVPVNTFHKIWIVPNKATVLESGLKAYITESSMKVMLEEDYRAKSINNAADQKDISMTVVRETILPAIEKDVNTGKNFAYLRQMQNAIILAMWFKNKLKTSIYNQLYIDKKKIAGVNTNDPGAVDNIYNQYVDAFKQGVYNYSKKDFNPASQRIINRRYYSGGIEVAKAPAVVPTDVRKFEEAVGRASEADITVDSTGQSPQAPARSLSPAEAQKANEQNAIAGPISRGSMTKGWSSEDSPSKSFWPTFLTAFFLSGAAVTSHPASAVARPNRAAATEGKHLMEVDAKSWSKADQKTALDYYKKALNAERNRIREDKNVPLEEVAARMAVAKAAAKKHITDPKSTDPEKSGLGLDQKYADVLDYDGVLLVDHAQADVTAEHNARTAEQNKKNMEALQKDFTDTNAKDRTGMNLAIVDATGSKKPAVYKFSVRPKGQPQANYEIPGEDFQALGKILDRLDTLVPMSKSELAEMTRGLSPSTRVYVNYRNNFLKKIASPVDEDQQPEQQKPTPIKQRFQPKPQEPAKMIQGPATRYNGQRYAANRTNRGTNQRNNMGRNSLGTGSTGVKGLSLTGHRQHELEANIPAAVKAFGEEIGAPRVTRVVHGEAIQVSDFKAFLKARKTDRYATDNGSVLIDPVTGFLVLRLKGIERGHIGRGSYNEGIAIYAGMGEKGQVIHEIDEATVLINYLVNDKHYPREQVLQGLGQILDDMLDNGNLDVWREVINVKWQAHKAGLEAQAQAESWDPKDLEKEIAAADKEMYKELEEVTKNLKPEMRSRLEDKLNELAELEAQSIDAGEGGTLLSLAVRAHREALSGVVGQATKDYDRVRQEIELRKEIVGIETLLGVWNDSEEFSASLGTASNTDDGNKPPTKGGITEEGLKLRVNSDGTEVAVFKDVPLDIKNFNGFGFQIMAIGRNKTGAEIIMAKSI